MITKKQFNTFEDLFNYYNSELFDNELPEVMINMSRKKNSMGFFAPNRWTDVSNDSPVHEISLNPDYLVGPVQEWHQTLVHEMVHLWRNHTDEKGKIGYHDKVWSAKMESIGLMPSSTGKPGGRKTGQKMSDYAVDPGPFLEAFNRIQGEDFSDLILPFLPAPIVPKMTKEGNESKQGKKVKYTCACGNNLWGKSDLVFTCQECNTIYQQQ